MKRARIEYGKAAVAAVCAALVLAMCVDQRSLDGSALIVVLCGLVWYFVLRARTFTRSARSGCGRAPRP